MKTNRNIEKEPNIESSIFMLGNIVDLCSDSKYNLLYMTNLVDVKSNLQKIKNIITDIENMLEKVN
jgi:hypothetical protein